MQVNKKILEHFKQNDPLLYPYILKVDFKKWLSFNEKYEQNYFLALCRDIIGQQLSGKAAQTIFNRFLNLFKSKHVAPLHVIKKTDNQLREIGLSNMKTKYIKDLAQKIISNEIDLESIDSLSNEEIIEKLTKVKGIGKWTCEMFMMFTLKRPDVFSQGDLGLKKGMQKVYNKKTLTVAFVNKMIKKWSPYNTYAAFALWQSLD